MMIFCQWRETVLLDKGPPGGMSELVYRWLHWGLSLTVIQPSLQSGPARPASAVSTYHREKQNIWAAVYFSYLILHFKVPFCSLEMETGLFQGISLSLFVFRRNVNFLTRNSRALEIPGLLVEDKPAVILYAFFQEDLEKKGRIGYVLPDYITRGGITIRLTLFAGFWWEMKSGRQLRL